MKEEFVTYEQALILGKLGFDLLCFAKYTVIPEDNINWFTIPELSIADGKTLFGANKNYNTAHFKAEDTISAPTFSQAFKWFSKKYGVAIYVYQPNNTGYWAHSLENKAKYNTYEEAELECLNTLISAVENV